MVSGDCQRRSLILPITNISGKAKSATLELREKIEGNANVDPNLLISAPELGNIRNVRVLGPTSSLTGIAPFKAQIGG